jgi:hypothetical protein
LQIEVTPAVECAPEKGWLLLIISKLNERLGDTLHAISPRGYKLALSVTALTCALNALWVTYQIGFSYGRAGCGYPCTSGHQDFTQLLIQLRITIALTVVVFGLFSRRPAGFLISALALAYVAAEYLWWYFDSLRWLKEVGVEDFSKLPAPHEIQYAGNLYGATWWDLVVLAVAIILFTWEMKVLLRTLTTSQSSSQLP